MLSDSDIVVLNLLAMMCLTFFFIVKMFQKENLESPWDVFKDDKKK